MIRDWLKTKARSLIGRSHPADPERRRLLGLGATLAAAAAAPVVAVGTIRGIPPETGGPARRTRMGILGLGTALLNGGDTYGGEKPSDYDDSYWARHQERTSLCAVVPRPGVIRTLVISSDDPTSMSIVRICVAGRDYVYGEPAPVPGQPPQLRPGEFLSESETVTRYQIDQEVSAGDEVLVGFRNADASVHIVTAGFTFEIEG